MIIKPRYRYNYTTLKRQDLPDGRRYVNEVGDKLPSVTTILSHSKDKSGLIEWTNRVGKEEAERIRDNAAKVGTAMHSFIESHVKLRPVPYAKRFYQIKGYRMGAGLIETFFEDLDEVWGSEVMVYKDGSYAGTIDLSGVFRGEPSIIDFKQSNKMKKREWIDDYFIQLAAYADAHNHQFDTNIRQGVVLMASQDGFFKDFVICGREFDSYLDQWRQKLKVFTSEVVDSSSTKEQLSHLETKPHTS